MKKTIALLLALVFAMTLVSTFTACKKDDPGTTEAPTPSGTPGTPDGSADGYTITFDSKGGSAVAPVKASAGAEITAPADPTREGYAFLGWFESTDGGTTLSEKAFVVGIMPARNVTLYAKWGPLTAGNKIYTETDFVVTWGSDEDKANVLEEMEMTEEQLIAGYRAMGVKLVFDDVTVSLMIPGAEFSKTGLYYSVGADGIITFFATVEDKASNTAYEGSGLLMSTFIMSADYKTIIVRGEVRPGTYFDIVLTAS